MSDVKAKITFVDDGASVAFDKVSAAAKENAAAAKSSSDALRSATEATKAATPNYGQFGSTVGLVGASLGRLNPALGQTVTTGAAALGSIQALTTAGMGPLGIAVAAVSVAVTAATGLYSAYTAAEERARESAEAEREAIEKATLAIDARSQALRDMLDTLDKWIAREKIVEDVAARNEALAQGRAGLTAQRALERLRQDEAQAASAKELIATYRLSSLAMAHDTDATAEQARVVTELTRLREQAERNLADAVRGRATAEALANAEAERAAKAVLIGKFGVRPEATSRTSAARGGRAGASGDADRQAAEDARSREEDAASRLAQLTEDMDAEAEVRQRARDLEIRESNDAKDDAVRIARARAEAVLAEKKRELAEAAEASAQMESVFAGIGEGVKSVADAVMSGNATLGEATMGFVRKKATSIMIESGLEALLETAKGIQAIAGVYTAPLAVGHFLSAAKFGAVAAVAGVVAGASGAFSGGGGGGAPATSAPSAGPAPRPQSDAERDGGKTTVIFAGGVITAATEAQLGRQIRRLVGNTSLGAT